MMNRSSKYIKECWYPLYRRKGREYEKGNNHTRVPFLSCYSIHSNLFAIDCEMVETKGGVDELARVSIVSSKGVILDEYVLPEGEVVDYRTNYSGITPAILKKCTNRTDGVWNDNGIGFKDIQKRVYSILSQKHSIVVGHSLGLALIVLFIRE